MGNKEVAAPKPEKELANFKVILKKYPWLENDMFLNWLSLVNHCFTEQFIITAECYSDNGGNCGYQLSVAEIITGFKKNERQLPCPRCKKLTIPQLRYGKKVLFLMSPAEVMYHLSGLDGLKDWMNHKPQTITLIHNATLYFGGVYQAFVAMEMRSPIDEPRTPKNWLEIAKRFRDTVPRAWLAQVMCLNKQQLSQI